MITLAVTTPPAGLDMTATIFAILGSAVLVLGGLVSLTRAIWKAAQDLRDTRGSVRALTEKMGELKTMMDGRITGLESQVAVLSGKVETLERTRP